MSNTTATALHDAINQLDTAVERLFAPQHTTHGPTTSLWGQLIESVGNKPPQGTNGVFQPGAPAWIDAIDIIETIERTVRRWAGIHDDPQTILEPWCHPQAWRPQDSPTITDHAHHIHAWCRKAERLLNNYSVMEVKAPCPECQRTIYHDTNQYGERVRKPALEVTTNECVCNICGTTWPPEHFELLAQAIGCTPLDQKAAQK